MTYELSEEDIESEDWRANILIDLSDYADRNPDFNAKFVDSVRDMCDRYGRMSASQYNTLVKIYFQVGLNEDKE